MVAPSQTAAAQGTEGVTPADKNTRDPAVLPENECNANGSIAVKEDVSGRCEADSLSTDPVSPSPVPNPAVGENISVQPVSDGVAASAPPQAKVDKETVQISVAPSLPSEANIDLDKANNSVAPLFPLVAKVDVQAEKGSGTPSIPPGENAVVGPVQDSVAPSISPQKEVDVCTTRDSIALSVPSRAKDDVETIQDSVEPSPASLPPPSQYNGETRTDAEEESKALAATDVAQLLNQTSDSSDSSSESSDTEESDSGESDESDDDSDTSSSCSEIGKILAEVEDDSRKESPNVVPSEVIFSKNEVKTDAIQIPPVTVKISERDSLTCAGVIHSILEHEVIVRSATSNEDELRHTWNKEEIDGSKAFNVDTLMCFENRAILGMVFDTVGPVHAPYYIVRFNTSEEIASISDIQLGAKVFAVQSHSQVVMGRDVHIKGYDTSNKDDEEYDNGEYSDDEEERAARRRKNLMHRQRMIVDEDDHRPFKQTRGDAQEATDLGSENPYVSTPDSPDARRGKFRTRSRGRGRGRGRGGNVGREAVVGREYGQPGPYMAMPVPQYGHMAHQILQARLPPHQMGGARQPPPPMGYSQTTAGHMQPMAPPVYAQAPGPYAQPVASMPPMAPVPHVAWNGGQYVQVPVSPMQHYAVQGMGYPGVPQAQMQAMAGMRNMSVGDNPHFPPVQYPPPHHPNSNPRPGDQHGYYRRQ